MDKQRRIEINLGLDEKKKKKQNDHMSDIPSSALKGDLTRLIDRVGTSAKSNFEITTSRFKTDENGKVYTSYTIGEDQARALKATPGEHRTYVPKDGIINPGIKYDINYVRMDSDQPDTEEVNRTSKDFFLTDLARTREEGTYKYVLRDERGNKPITLFTSDNGRTFYTNSSIKEYEIITPTPSKIEPLEK